MTKYMNNFQDLLNSKIKKEYQDFDKVKYDFNYYKNKLDTTIINNIDIIHTQFQNYIKTDELNILKKSFLELKQLDIDEILIKLYDDKSLQEGGAENRETLRNRDLRLVLTEQEQQPIRNTTNYKTDIISILFLIFGFFILYIAYYILQQLPTRIENMGMHGLDGLIIRIQEEILNSNILTIRGFIDIICGFRLGGNTTLQTFNNNLSTIVMNYIKDLGLNTIGQVTDNLSFQCGIGRADNYFDTIVNTIGTLVAPTIKNSCVYQGLILNSNQLMIQYGMIINKLSTDFTTIICLINYGVPMISVSTCYLINRIRNRNNTRTINTTRNLQIEGGRKYKNRTLKNNNRKKYIKK